MTPICTFAVFFSISRPFCSFTLVYEGHFVLCYKEKIQLLDREVIGRLISAVICMSLRWVWHLYNLPCVSVLFWLTSIFKSPRICFWGLKYDVYRERVVYLHYMLWRRAQLRLELFASPADKFFSRVSYLPSYVFLGIRRRFTSRKLYACLEKFLCFLQLSTVAHNCHIKTKCSQQITNRSHQIQIAHITGAPSSQRDLYTSNSSH